MITSKYFQPEELVDPETFKMFGYHSYQFMHPDLLQGLDELRELLGLPIIINNWHSNGQYKWSGLRTVNCKEGAAMSAHRFGMAADIKLTLYNPLEIIQKILQLKLQGKLKTITRMELDTPTWVHIDCMFTGIDKLVTFNPPKAG